MAPTTAPINVFVTGFGPFPRGDGGTYEQNSSHLITKRLPSHITPSSPSAQPTRTINILNPTAAPGAAVKVEYAHIRSYVSQLHDAHSKDVDLFLHIGMAAGWRYVSVEQRAYKQGFSSAWWGKLERKAYYMIPDAAGKTIEDAGECPWSEDVPMGLEPGMDTEAVVRGANAILATDGEERESAAGGKQGVGVRAHHEPGAYGCGFIFYESLANKYTKGTRGQILFCHVPGETDEESIERGKDAIVAVIRAAVAQMVDDRESEGSDGVPFPA